MSAAGRAKCNYGCGFRARFVVADDERSENTCARHLAFFVKQFADASGDDTEWFKVAPYDEGDDG